MGVLKSAVTRRVVMLTMAALCIASAGGCLAAAAAGAGAGYVAGNEHEKEREGR
jgi:hypothetical protein